MRIKFRAAITLVLCVLAACATAGEDATPSRERDVTVVVENRNRLDMRVSIVRSGVAVHLGIVTSGGEQTFAMPPDFVGATDLRLRAEPVGSRVSIETRGFVIRPGDVVEWTIRERAESSSLAIY